MTYLLDANVLIALCDTGHAHHDHAHRWFSQQRIKSWATCPITENAFVRVTSNTNYPRSTGSVASQLSVLRELCTMPGHEFWPDDISLTDSTKWLELDYANSRNITDLYLLSLAVNHKGKFATLDQSIPADRVKGGPDALHRI